MMKERPDKCFSVHAELLFPAPVCVVFIAESTVPSIHRDNTAVRDGGSEGITRKVAYGVFPLPLKVSFTNGSQRFLNILSTKDFHPSPDFRCSVRESPACHPGNTP